MDENQFPQQEKVTELPPEQTSHEEGVAPEEHHDPYKKRNWFELLALYFVIGMVAYAGFYYYIYYAKSPQKDIQASPSPSPTQVVDETANWKPYSNTNSVASFSLKYPPSWTLQEENGTTAINSNQTFKKVPNDVEGVTYWINITPYQNPNNLEFKELVTKDLPADLKKSFTYTTETINNNVAYRTTSLPSQSGCEWVFFKKDANYIGANFCMYNREKPFIHQEEFYPIFNKLLATFQFTDQGLDTSNWKIVTLKNMNFKIPQDWHTYNASSSDIFFNKVMISPPPWDSPPGFEVLVTSNTQMSAVVSKYKSDYTNVKTSNKLVLNYQAQQVDISIPPGYDGSTHILKALLIQVGSDTYTFSVFDTNVSKEYIETYFDKIISTFKFQ